ncbi:major facilitator superfamily domain-containing protein [Mycena vulgaris]|nr:major facilitator superfamily domain-containing protein [Mycena vulgaris]
MANRTLNSSELDRVDPELKRTEGTWHQQQVGLQRWTFFRPSAAYASAVSRDAEDVEYSETEERVVKRKLDRIILPLIACGYVTLSKYLDIHVETHSALPVNRTNIGNAHVLPEFNENYGITDNRKWTLALGIFYVGYCLCISKASIIQRRVGGNRFFSALLAIWGFCSLSFVYASGYPSFLLLRNELSKRLCLTLNFALPGAIGGLLAFGLVRAHTSHLAGLSNISQVESLPTIMLSFAILIFLPSFPFAAWFLSPRERAIAHARLNRDQKPQMEGGWTGWQSFKAVVADPNAWLLLVTYGGFNVAAVSMSYFLPTVIKDLGFSAINAQGLTAAPYAFAFIVNLIQTSHSDRVGERGWHLMFSAAMAFTGYILLAIQKNVASSYFALFLVVTGNQSVFPLALAWAANTFSPTPKRGIGTAFIMSVNAFSIASPQIYFDPEDKFRKGHAIVAGCVALSFASTLVLRIRITKLNKRNGERLANLPEQEKSTGSEEIWDSDPRYVFTT